VEYVGFCDVYDPSARAAKQSLGTPDAQDCRDFRRLLERKDVHAIHVATPDHWHGPITILACQAGKDVYVEKPLGLTVREGRAMVEAARKNNRIVQTGMQHRSAPHYKEVEDIIQSGQLGEVHFVHVCNYSTVYTALGAPPADEQPPEGLDWDFYLGPAPKVPYNRLRFRTYRRFFDYSGGFITDFGGHRLDSVHQVMHDDKPITAMGVGGLFASKSIVDTPNVLHVTYEYKDFVLSYEGIQLNGFGTGPRLPGGRRPYGATGTLDRPHGEAFYGTKGTIFSDRIGYEWYPGRGASGDPKSIAGADRTDLHVIDFINCMRSRKKPSADVEVGHRSTIVAHLGNISYRIGGRKIQWNAAQEEIIGDAEAAAMLSRRAREPWNLVG
jgi:predicted dehydrogenase